MVTGIITIIFSVIFWSVGYIYETHYATEEEKRENGGCKYTVITNVKDTFRRCFNCRFYQNPRSSRGKSGDHVEKEIIRMTGSIPD